MAESTMPPPKHGNGAFIGAAVVMLLGMGGLLFWKFAGKEEPPPAPPPVASVRQEPPVLDEPPPPPPPIEEAKEEPKEEEKPTKRVVARGPSGCSGTCSGGAPATLHRALAATAGMSRGCYERALRTNATLQGKMVVSLRISSTGSVCSAGIGGNTVGDPSVSSCVLQKFRSGTFPKPNGGCVDVNVPISFRPRTP